MKRSIAYLASIGRIGHDGTMRATLASGLAIALGLGVGVPTARAGDDGRCAAYDAATVDENFLEWSAASGFDPSLGTVRCVDLRTGRPTIVFIAATDDGTEGTFFEVKVVPSGADPGLNAALRGP